jgi:hypothetical protein
MFHATPCTPIELATLMLQWQHIQTVPFNLNHCSATYHGLLLIALSSVCSTYLGPNKQSMHLDTCYPVPCSRHMSLHPTRIQMLTLGLACREVLDACDLLRQICLLNERLASAVLAEGALWHLATLLITLDTTIKERRRATDLLPRSTNASPYMSLSLAAHRRHHCLGTDVLSTQLSLPLPGASSVPVATRSHVTGLVVPDLSAAHRQEGQGGDGKIATVTALEASVSQAAMATVVVLLQQCEGAQASFLLLGGVAAVLSLLAELQVQPWHLNTLCQLCYKEERDIAWQTKGYKAQDTPGWLNLVSSTPA